MTLIFILRLMLILLRLLLLLHNSIVEQVREVLNHQNQMFLKTSTPAWDCNMAIMLVDTDVCCSLGCCFFCCCCCSIAALVLLFVDAVATVETVLCLACRKLLTVGANIVFVVAVLLLATVATRCY